MRPSLPDPDRGALERSRHVARLIREAIGAAADNTIGFDRYMDLALYTPGLGYYAADNQIFGGAGDFVTAPESGELFGLCIARQCAEILPRTGSQIVEYGAGSGHLARTVLQGLHEAGWREIRYHIVEPSAQLRERQRRLLDGKLPLSCVEMTWSEDHRAQPFSGVVIANEVLDAMPARRYVVQAGKVSELGVGLADDEFVWRARSGGEVPAPITAVIGDYEDGYCCESIPALESWLSGVRGCLERGIVLVCDYGYPRHEFLHRSRGSGTLKCHYQHQMHGDPFLLPGLQDLTTAVNFSDLAELAVQAGFEVAGFTTQTRFLLDCALEQIMAERSGSDAADNYLRAQEAKRLLLPGEMGQSCKFMALGVDYQAPLSGFSNDQRHRLDGFAAEQSA